jgi:hypothetical protein
MIFPLVFSGTTTPILEVQVVFVSTMSFIDNCIRQKVDHTTRDITRGHTTGPNALGGADMGYRRKTVVSTLKNR